MGAIRTRLLVALPLTLARHRLMRSRIPGLAEFARSLGRDERDRAVVALFETLREERGPEVE